MSVSGPGSALTGSAATTAVGGGAFRSVSGGEREGLSDHLVLPDRRVLDRTVTIGPFLIGARASGDDGRSRVPLAVVVNRDLRRHERGERLDRAGIERGPLAVELLNADLL